MAARGFFICFEGLDGVGKTTQIELLLLVIESVVKKAPNRASETGKVLDKYLRCELELPRQASELLFFANQWDINWEFERLIKVETNMSSGGDAQPGAKKRRPTTMVADGNFISGVAYGHARSGREYVERCVMPA